MGKLLSLKILALGCLVFVLTPDLSAQEKHPEKTKDPHSILESEREITHGGLHNLKELFGLG
ncbi:MAG: hypothetical protein KJO90_05815, partial [Eudoraea sp.]|nr:hypothetical protein [Eudoraea sp.]